MNPSMRDRECPVLAVNLLGYGIDEKVLDKFLNFTIIGNTSCTTYF